QGAYPYSQASYPVAVFSVDISPAVGGKVVSIESPPNISCKPTCSYNYLVGDIVTLKPTPQSSYWKFTGWTLDCLAFGTNNCVLLLNGPKSTTAVFEPRSLNYTEF